MNHLIDFRDEKEKRAFVARCEAGFRAQLDAAVEAVVSRPDVRIVTVSGPTSSGKTTTSKKLVSELELRGRHVHVVSLDDFYYDREFLVSESERLNEPLDLDSPSTIDLPALTRTVGQIEQGETIELPHFDFNKGYRDSVSRIRAKESDVFLFEGIQAMYPSVRALFSSFPYLSIYISVAEDAQVGDRTIDRNDVRLLRRLVRDHLFRSAHPSFTLSVWDSVRANEEENIFPYEDACDIRINSYLAYEPYMIAPYAQRLLEAVSPEDPHYTEAQRLLALLHGLPRISSTYLPPESVYHEFLG